MRPQINFLPEPRSLTRSLAHPRAGLSCRWAVLGHFAVLAFGAQPGRAAVTVSKSDDHASAIVRDAAGDLIVAGSTDDGTTGPDMLIIKYSGADGSVRWQKRYNGPANGADRARAVAVDRSGNVVVTGSSRISSLGNHSLDYYTAKYAAADGALLWEKRYNGSGK